MSRHCATSGLRIADGGLFPDAHHDHSICAVRCPPGLIAVPHDVFSPRPFVFWCHGFRADSLADAAELERLYAAEFLGVASMPWAACGLPVRAAVMLLGDPEWRNDDRPHRQLTRFADVALLSVTAEHDVSVPSVPVRRFYLSLRGTFDSLRHHPHELRGAGHLTSEAPWDEA